MKKLFVALVVAALFAPLSFAEEGKKKDSFADVGMPTDFAMGYAKATDPCPSNGDIAMSKEGLILSCQSDSRNTERHRWVSIFDSAEITNPGYTRLPSGLVIQFGSVGEWSGSTSDRTAPIFISFKKAFSNRCISATANHMLGYGGASAANWSSIKSCDKNGIQFGITAPGRQWMAIGY